MKPFLGEYSKRSDFYQASKKHFIQAMRLSLLQKEERLEKKSSALHLTILESLLTLDTMSVRTTVHEITSLYSNRPIYTVMKEYMGRSLILDTSAVNNTCPLVQIYMCTNFSSLLRQSMQCCAWPVLRDKGANYRAWKCLWEHYQVPSCGSINLPIEHWEDNVPTTLKVYVTSSIRHEIFPQFLILGRCISVAIWH